MVTTVGQKVPGSMWDAPWAPSDPAEYMANVGVTVNHIHIASAVPAPTQSTRSTSAAARSAIAEATGVSVDIPDRPERSERVQSSADDGFGALDDELAAAAYDSPRLRPSTDPYAFTPERNPFGDGTDEAAKAAVHRMRTEAKSETRRTLDRASKDRRNARDRDKRLKAAIAKLAAGGRLSGPTPRGR
jgi:hypothetical protein